MLAFWLDRVSYGCLDLLSLRMLPATSSSPNDARAKGHVLTFFSIIPICFSVSRMPHRRMMDPMASWLMARLFSFVSMFLGFLFYVSLLP